MKKKSSEDLYEICKEIFAQVKDEKVKDLIERACVVAFEKGYKAGFEDGQNFGRVDVLLKDVKEIT